MYVIGEALVEACAHCRLVWNGREPRSEHADIDWEYVPETDEFVHSECLDAYRARLRRERRAPTEVRRAGDFR